MGEDDPVVVRLEPYAGRLLTIHPVIGQDTLTLLFDTGGGQTLLSPAVTTKLDCEAPGHSVGFRMSGEQVDWPTCGGAALQLESERLEDVRFGVWDVMSVLPEGLPELDGVFSLDALGDRRVTLDLANRSLILETNSSFGARTPVMTEVPSRNASGIAGDQSTFFVEVDLESVGTGWFLLDSANLDRVIISDRWGVQSDSLTLGFGGLETVAAIRTQPILYDGVLSEALLSRFVVTLDLNTDQVWLLQESSRDH